MTRNDIEEISMATGNWGKTRAFVTVKFVNGLTLNGAKVLEGTKGLFVGMPSIQRKDKESGEMKWKDCCWVEDKEDRQVFQDVIIEAYKAKVQGSGSQVDGSGEADADTSSFF